MAKTKGMYKSGTHIDDSKYVNIDVELPEEPGFGTPLFESNRHLPGREMTCSSLDEQVANSSFVNILWHDHDGRRSGLFLVLLLNFLCWWGILRIIKMLTALIVLK